MDYRRWLDPGWPARTRKLIIMDAGMLNSKDASPRALQRLFAEQLLPLIVGTPPKKLRLAATCDPNAPALKPPPGLPGHQHFFSEVCFCLAGEAEFWVGDCLQRVTQGGAVIIPPSVFHSSASLHAVTIPTREAYSRLLWMSLFPYGCVVNLCESSNGQHSSTPRQLVVERHANSYLQEMILELKTGDGYSSTVAKCKLIEALVWICRGDERHWAVTSPPSLELPAASSSDERSVSGRCRRFIEEHFDRSLDLEIIAQAVCTNKSNLCRVFRNDTGMTIGEYVTKIRIDASKRLLLTSLSVSAVANLVGFEDPYYFSRVFRRQTGASPSEFRSRLESEKCHTSGEGPSIADSL